MFPKSGALWKQTPNSRALLNIFFGVPSKGVLPPGPLHEVPQREMPRFYSPPSFIFCSPRYEPRSRFQVPHSHTGPLWREMPISRAFLNNPGSPVEEPPFKALSIEPLQREMLNPYSPLHPSLKVPGRQALFQVPQWGPYAKGYPSPQPLLHNLQGPQ